MQLFWNKIFGRIVDEAKKAKTGPELLAHVDTDADNDDVNGNKNNARKISLTNKFGEGPQNKKVPRYPE